MKIVVCLSALCIFLSCGQQKSDKQVSNTDTSSKTSGTSLVDDHKTIQLTDLTNKYAISYAPWADTAVVRDEDIRIAVIPKDSIGKLSIAWHDLKKDHSVVSEKDFENELMKCIDGKDKATFNGAAKTTRLALYCEREGYSDWGGMESYPMMYYAAFEKDNNLIIAEIFTSWYKCEKRETKKDQEDCKGANDKQRNSIRAFMDNMVKTITVNTKSVSDAGFSSKADAVRIIGTPIKLGKVEVAANDFPDLLTWELAGQACQSLGQGWRLPTKNELNEIYKSRSSLGNFTADLYWTSEDVDEINAHTQNMETGKQGRFSKIYMCKIRAVRSL